MQTTAPTTTLRTALNPTTILVILGLALGCSLFLWDNPLLLPLKVFTVYIHEACHALASILTGGRPLTLQVSLNESGQVLSRGGFFPVVASGGYVGTAAIGAILIALSRHPYLQKAFVALLCGLLLYLTATVLQIWQWEFWAGALLAVSWLWFNLKVPQLALFLNLFIGSFLCVYSVHDFQDFFYAVQSTDAGILANGLGLPFLAWPIALIWIVLNLTMMSRAISYALKSH
ncbi:M50 family metallopeptidase [Candidatus Cyanaurora vandensis]|uniref:M50 family metallopeptidase n=1 Tax=Candidatus Cyanaurora vandensis TaxID=2714958 RepID=UPI00257D0631|nr:M50 family metallopeptidase [Candidatus Cyanaurora vandensis]